MAWRWGRIRVFLTARILAAVPCSAPAQVYQDMLDQIGALDEIVREEGGQLQHVKPHGALYNQAAGDEALAEAIARAVHDYHPGLKLVGLAGGALVRQARLQGLNAVEEVFADRAYLADGSLAPRELPGAVIVNPVQGGGADPAAGRARPVTSQDGRTVQLRADSVCLHGDSARAGCGPTAAARGWKRGGFRCVRSEPPDAVDAVSRGGLPPAKPIQRCCVILPYSRHHLHSSGAECCERRDGGRGIAAHRWHECAQRRLCRLAFCRTART